jgi:hypothetical protein
LSTVPQLDNTASFFYSIILGGEILDNTASFFYSIILGGNNGSAAG